MELICPNATGPVNIIPTPNHCFNKCRLNYKFAKTGVNTSHHSDYISIVPNDSNTPTVVYSSANTSSCRNGGESNYGVEDMRIHHPSLHTYGKKQIHAAAELIIRLNNITGGRNLIICIPITNKNGSQPHASEQLTQIVDFLSKMGNSTGENGTVQGLYLDINAFIPKKKGFYAYTATLPTPPCTKCIDYVVYDIHDAAISLDHNILRKIKKLIAITYTKTLPITKKIGYSYNKKGAEFGIGKNDAIWIDCQPTGNAGNLLVEETKEGILTNNTFRMFNNMSDQQINALISFWVIIAIIPIAAYAFNKFKNIPKKYLGPDK